MFKHSVNGANNDRVNKTSRACVACPNGSPLFNAFFLRGFANVKIVITKCTFLIL